MLWVKDTIDDVLRKLDTCRNAGLSRAFVGVEVTHFSNAYK